MHAPNAVADWQYTKWGMTPDEVIVASAGRATLIDPQFTPSGKTVYLLKAEHQSGLFHFEVQFGFSAAPRKLIIVNLKLKNTAEAAPSLRYSLVSKYGKPDFSQDGDVTRALWRDLSAGNIIEYLAIRGLNLYIVSYKPLHHPDASEL